MMSKISRLSRTSRRAAKEAREAEKRAERTEKESARLASGAPGARGRAGGHAGSGSDAPPRMGGVTGTCRFRRGGTARAPPVGAPSRADAGRIVARRGAVRPVEPFGTRQRRRGRVDFETGRMTSLRLF